MKESINFCTYFDKNYLAKFILMKLSLEKFISNINFYILLLDDETINFFGKKKYKNVRFIKLNNLEREFKVLEKLKKKRSKIEYYFTLSPFLPIFIKKKYSLNHLIYLDSDILFLKNPYNYFKNNLKKNSITLVKQNTNPKFGKFNVGMILYNFKFNETENILNFWKRSCIEWCYDICQKGRYADQKYLDYFPQKGRHVKQLNPNFSLLSPWDKKICLSTNLRLNYAYHFHGIKIFKNFFISGFYNYNKKIPKEIKNLYISYSKSINYYNENYFSNINQFLRYSSKSYYFNVFRYLKLFFKVLIKRDFIIMK